MSENTKTTRQKRRPIDAQKKKRPEQPIIPKKAAYRDSREIYAEILQTIFCEYQREVYFCKKKEKPFIILNVTTYDEEGRFKDVHPVTAKFHDKRMLTIDFYAKDGTLLANRTVWELIEHVIHAKDFRITSYQLEEPGNTDK